LTATRTGYITARQQGLTIGLNSHDAGNIRFAVDLSIYGKTILALGQRRITMVQKTDWSKIENVFAFLEKKDEGRKLRESEKELILGQRQINRRFFEALKEILETMSPSMNAPQRSVAQSTKALTALKKSISKVPGERPPGCAGDLGK